MEDFAKFPLYIIRKKLNPNLYFHYKEERFGPWGEQAHIHFTPNIFIAARFLSKERAEAEIKNDFVIGGTEIIKINIQIEIVEE